MVFLVMEKFNRSYVEKVKCDFVFDYIFMLFFVLFLVLCWICVCRWIYVYDDIGFFLVVDDVVEFKYYCRIKFYCWKWDFK